MWQNMQQSLLQAMMLATSSSATFATQRETSNLSLHHASWIRRDSLGVPVAISPVHGVLAQQVICRMSTHLAFRYAAVHTIGSSATLQRLPELMLLLAEGPSEGVMIQAWKQVSGADMVEDPQRWMSLKPLHQVLLNHCSIIGVMVHRKSAWFADTASHHAHLPAAATGQQKPRKRFSNIAKQEDHLQG
mmetsp:Transcript_101083/g.261781  ORF Transcript_101083/g.261781 Transcript_101083/m.261781 type:complete len:189 (+) Transcript_101083:2328-2894(+)